MMFTSAWVLVAAGIAVTRATPLMSMPDVLDKRQQSAGGMCSSPDFAAITVVGGTGTSTGSFCESSWGTSYLPVTNITMWSNNEAVTGLQLTYSDGSQSPILGGTAQVKQNQVGVVYGSNDLWSNVRMWSDSNEFVRHLLLKTSTGAVINGGEAVSSDPNLVESDQDVGSGILFGVTGTTHSNGNVASLGFLFLASPIANIGVSNVQFPNGPLGGSDGINPTTIGTAHFDNTDSNSVTFQFNNQLAETQMWSFAQAFTNTFTVMEAIQFSFGIKILIVTAGGSSTTTFTWTDTSMETTTNTVSQSVQVQYNAAVTLQPGQSADCTAVAGQGAGTFPYTSTVTITLKNGHQYSFPESGELTVSAFSQGRVSCTNGQVSNGN